jgi:hypothetical protein
VALTSNHGVPHAIMDRVVAHLILTDLLQTSKDPRICRLITMDIEVVCKKDHGHLEAQLVRVFVQISNMEAQGRRMFLLVNMDLGTVLMEDHDRVDPQVILTSRPLMYLLVFK